MENMRSVRKVIISSGYSPLSKILEHWWLEVIGCLTVVLLLIIFVNIVKQIQIPPEPPVVITKYQVVSIQPRPAENSKEKKLKKK